MWLIDVVKSWIIQFIIDVMNCGPIPKHIAFILDGNRRFAKKIKANKKSVYDRAINKADKIFDLCRVLGIKNLSMYGLSIENLKRSPEEVKTLEELIYNFLKKYVTDERVVDCKIQVKVAGNLTLTPTLLRKAFAKAILDTKQHDNLKINLALYYTSTNEITAALQAILEGVNSGMLKIEDIDECFLSDCLYISKINPDLYIRTSGETRLSDFLLWQTEFTQIFFLKPNWPELSFWNVFSTILTYQENVEKLNHIISCMKAPPKRNPRIQGFLEHLEENRINKLIEYANVDEI